MFSICLFSISYNQEKGKLDLLIQSTALVRREGGLRPRNWIWVCWTLGKVSRGTDFSKPLNFHGSARLPLILSRRFELVVLSACVESSKFKYAFVLHLISFQMEFLCSHCRGNGSSKKDPFSTGEDLHGLAAETECWSRTLQCGQHVLPQCCPAVLDLHPPTGQLPALPRAQPGL